MKPVQNIRKLIEISSISGVCRLSKYNFNQNVREFGNSRGSTPVIRFSPLSIMPPKVNINTPSLYPSNKVSTSGITKTNIIQRGTEADSFARIRIFKDFDEVFER